MGVEGGRGGGAGGKLCFIKPYPFSNLNSVNKIRFDYTTLASGGEVMLKVLRCQLT